MPLTSSERSQQAQALHGTVGLFSTYQPVLQPAGRLSNSMPFRVVPTLQRWQLPRQRVRPMPFCRDVAPYPLTPRQQETGGEIQVQERLSRKAAFLEYRR